jgi:hypothetical protein
MICGALGAGLGGGFGTMWYLSAGRLRPVGAALGVGLGKEIGLALAAGLALADGLAAGVGFAGGGDGIGIGVIASVGVGVVSGFPTLVAPGDGTFVATAVGAAAAKVCCAWFSAANASSEARSKVRIMWLALLSEVSDYLPAPVLRR